MNDRRFARTRLTETGRPIMRDILQSTRGKSIIENRSSEGHRSKRTAHRFIRGAKFSLSTNTNE